MTQRHADNNSHSQPPDFLILGESVCALSHTEHNQNCCHGHHSFDAGEPLFRNGTKTPRIPVFKGETLNSRGSGISGNTHVVPFQFVRSSSPDDKPAFVPKPPSPANAGNHSVSVECSPRLQAIETAATLTVSPAADVAADHLRRFPRRTATTTKTNTHSASPIRASGSNHIQVIGAL